MSKIYVNNDQLPVSANVRYHSTDNQIVNQTIPNRTTKITSKSLQPDTEVQVTVSGKMKEIQYEPGHRTLAILQEGAQNDFGLNWI